MTQMVVIAAAPARGLTIGVFLAVLAVTLTITFWAARRIRSATDFWSAGRGISGMQNGMAIAGEFLSAAAFLGVAGLMFLSGFDGYLTGIAALLSFVPLLLLLAERMRHAGRYTMADVLALRLSVDRVQVTSAISTMCIAALYVVAQSVAAGSLIEALVGIPFWVSVLITSAAMLTYVVLGGMVATTWVQIIKAALLMLGVATMGIWVLSRFGFDPIHLLNRAQERSGQGAAYGGPGLVFPNRVDEISVGLAFVLGTLGLPHIMMRFLTVPDARSARRSIGWAVGLIGVFYVFVAIIGLGGRAILGNEGVKLGGKSGNLIAPYLAQNLGGGPGSTGGDVFFAVISAIAFTTILAVVAGVVLAAAGAAAHDVYGRVWRKGHATEHQQINAGRVAVLVIGVIGTALALAAGKGFNVQLLTGLTFAVAASANFPTLLLALSWRRFNSLGAVVGIASGLISSIALIILSPQVWSGPASGAPFPLTNPAIVSIPVGFLGCVIGTLLGGREEVALERFDEVRVRAATGLGAEVGGGSASPGGAEPAAREPLPAR
ncbi:MAG: cation/acetate symporter ActP [Solirubrobacterales bacterium]|nr:cation/acetate symporter ActP [Solirubrobacterales bacterium]